MSLKKIFLVALLLAAALAGSVAILAQRPILGADQAPIEFSVAAGSGVRGAMRQVAEAGAPVSPLLLEALARWHGQATRIKAGTYLLKPGVSPNELVGQMARGEFLQASLTIIEGWTFAQMRAAIAAHPGLKQDAAELDDAELLARVTPQPGAPEFAHPEGLFFPDTYVFAKGSSDLLVYRQAHAQLMRRLQQAWANRAADLPYQNPYEALIMASIVEKETGREQERAEVAGVFVNRLRLGMLLQTDPTVIYGMGAAFDGNIRKRDLQTDTPYNTYTRAGLPPTPIALPGAASLQAATQPASTSALYFVARGDGSSHFSPNLGEHNRAVDKYQRRARP